MRVKLLKNNFDLYFVFFVIFELPEHLNLARQEIIYMKEDKKKQALSIMTDDSLNNSYIALHNLEMEGLSNE